MYYSGMSGQLLHEIKQTKPFASLEEEVLLNLVRTADHFTATQSGLFKPHGISAEQYNVLRILRGAGAGGLNCSEIGGRMLTRSPDITRLLDKMEAAGLARRERSETDRRVVTAFISDKGLALLGSLDKPVRESAHALLQHMPPAALKAAIKLLEQMRTPNSAPMVGRKAGKKRKMERETQ